MQLFLMLRSYGVKGNRKRGDYTQTPMKPSSQSM